MAPRFRFGGRQAENSPAAAGEWCGDDLPVLDMPELARHTRAWPLLEVIRIRCGFTREFFEREVDTCLEAFGETVQLLPAGGCEKDRLPGGLWLLSLRTAVNALGARRGRLLPAGAAPEDIGALGPRWTYGVFLAALLHHLPQAFGAVRVAAWADPGCVSRWSPFGRTLRDLGMKRCRVEWRVPPAEAVAVLKGLPLIWVGRHLSPAVLGWLSEDERLMAELSACLRGVATPADSAIADIVMQGSARTKPAAGEGQPAAAAAAVSDSGHGRSDAPREDLGADTGDGEYRSGAGEDAPACIEDVDARRRKGRHDAARDTTREPPTAVPRSGEHVPGRAGGEARGRRS